MQRRGFTNWGVLITYQGALMAGVKKTVVASTRALASVRPSSVSCRLRAFFILTSVVALSVSGCRVRRGEKTDNLLRGKSSTSLFVDGKDGAGGGAASGVSPGKRVEAAQGSLLTDEAQERAAGETETKADAATDPDPTTQPVPGAASAPGAIEGWRYVVFAGGTPISAPLSQRIFASLSAGNPVDVATDIVSSLEDEPYTNAGIGAALRLDGKTIEVSAAVQDGEGVLSQVGGMRRTLQPIQVARALYRIGGGMVFGTSADELTERLGLPLGKLETKDARAAYSGDLAQALHAGDATQKGPLYSLYVEPSALAAAMTSGEPAGVTRAQDRLPVFALVIAPDDSSALAWSSGGVPLALPGGPSTLLSAEQSPQLQGKSAVVVLAADRSCSVNSRDTIERLRSARSPVVLARRLERACSRVPYLLMKGDKVVTNIDGNTLFRVGWQDAQFNLSESDDKATIPSAEKKGANPAEGARAPRVAPRSPTTSTSTASGASELDSTVSPSTVPVLKAEGNAPTKPAAPTKAGSLAPQPKSEPPGAPIPLPLAAPPAAAKSDLKGRAE